MENKPEVNEPGRHSDTAASGAVSRDEFPRPSQTANWLDSLEHAVHGIIHVARYERNMRYHFAAAFIVLFLTLFLNLTPFEFVIIAVAITVVIFAEMMNTAVEVIVDTFTDKWHPAAKIAKDVSAGAVLVASIGAGIVGYWILSIHVFPPVEGAIRALERSSETVTAVTLIVVVILVVIMKSRVGWRHPFRGGMPSGHSALSFSVWTAIALVSKNPFIVLMTLILAVMVSHSRLLLRIHSFQEVVAGALIGTLTTLLLFQIFH